MLIFTVTLELDGKAVPNPAKEDLSVSVCSPGDPLKPTVMGGAGGSYHIGLKPGEGGQHYVDFCWRGTWAAEPYMLPVKDKNGAIPDHPYTPPPGKQGGSAPAPTSSTPATRTTASTTTSSPAKTTSTTTATTTAAAKVPHAPKCNLEGLSSSITDLEETQFTINSYDTGLRKLSAGGHKFDVSITNSYDEDREVPAPVVEDNSDGTYLVKYGPLDAGTYSISVTFKNDHVAGSPATVTVEEGVVGGALAELDILFVLRDKEGNAIKSKGGSAYLKAFSSKSSGLTITEPDEGSYSILLDTPGESVVDVQLSGKSIEGFPLEVKLD